MSSRWTSYNDYMMWLDPSDRWWQRKHSYNVWRVAEASHRPNLAKALMTNKGFLQQVCPMECTRLSRIKGLGKAAQAYCSFDINLTAPLASCWSAWLPQACPADFVC